METYDDLIRSLAGLRQEADEVRDRMRIALDPRDLQGRLEELEGGAEAVRRKMARHDAQTQRLQGRERG